MSFLLKLALALRVIYTVGMVLIVTLLLAPFQLIAIIFGLSFQRYLPLLWHKIMARVLRLHIEIPNKACTKRPLLLIANHQNWLDIIVLGTVMPLSFIAKSEVRGWAGFGWLARMQRTVFVNRERRGATGASANEISQRMIEGDAMVLFAEGTTSDGNSVLPFRTALFGAAQMAEKQTDVGSVAVQTVTIAYNRVRGGVAGRSGRKALAWYGDTDLVPHILQVLGMGPLGISVSFGEERALTADTDRKQLALECHIEAQANFAKACGF